MKSEFFCLLFYLDVQKIGWCLPLMGRAICLTQHIKSNADIFQKYSDKHTQECFSIHLKIFWLNWVYTKLTNASVYFKGLQHKSRSFTELSLPHLKFSSVLFPSFYSSFLSPFFVCVCVCIPYSLPWFGAWRCQPENSKVRSDGCCWRAGPRQPRTCRKKIPLGTQRQWGQALTKEPLWMARQKHVKLTHVEK